MTFAAFDCVRGTGPAYFKNVCTPVVEIGGRSNLRSAVHSDMFVIWTTSEFGWRSFHITAPAVWNALPVHLRSTSVSSGQFRAGLKTHLLNQEYTASSENYLFLECTDVYRTDSDWLTDTIVDVTITVCDLSFIVAFMALHKWRYFVLQLLLMGHTVGYC